MYEIYMVKDIDSLDDIAFKYNCSTDDLYRINGFDDNFEISNGMQIIVPVNDKNPYNYYTIKKGDNIFDIAKKFNIDYKVLLLLNGLDDSDYVYPNQTIIIPKDGFGIYYVKENETIKNVLSNINVDINDLLKENDNIYLRSDQVIIFKKK